ncbi:MAG: glycosyl hydrolase [Bacteroidota bacterium]
MIKFLSVLCIMLCVYNNTYAQQNLPPGSLPDNPETIFKNPPESAKPGVLWMWMGSNINKEQITKDLEALKKEGFNRTTMFSLSDVVIPWSMTIGKSPTPEIVSWTEPWWKLMRFAAEESKRLGMDFGTFNGSGYETSGGPWITPEKSMQEICWSASHLTGQNVIVKLWLPKPMINPRSNMPFPVYNPIDSTVENPVITARQTYFRDIAVVAIPVAGTVNKSQVIDLTAKMSADGTLTWNAPAGEWTVYRFGHTTMGALIQPAQPAAIGLECDKMNAEAVSFHIDHIINELKSHLGDLIGNGFSHVHFDSYEAGNPSWTPLMKQEFSKRRGYDLIPYLCTFAGRVIDNNAETEKFKHDFEETIKDLYKDVYFTIISNKLKAANLIFLSEPYGGPWRQDDVMPIVHHVMTEFWTEHGTYTPYELDPTVSALRKSDHNIIEAEAFTGQPADSKWDEYPAWLKPIGDAAFCAGVNRIVIHRFTHQPWDARYLPGNSMGQWGTHFDRTQTWWEPAKAMVQYWQRCQALLQWGSFVSKTTDDFRSDNVTDSIQIGFTHRRQHETNIYFVANTTHHAGNARCIFNVSGMQPELWDPVTGEMRSLMVYQENAGKTIISLQFKDAQSFFIVFRNKISAVVKQQENFSELKEIYTFKNKWQVKFDPTWGGPEKEIIFNTLTDWTSSDQKGIKYYSGTAVYRTVFSKPSSPKQSVLYLNLGKVNHIARVIMNGKDLGVVWTAPWQIKIPQNTLQSTNTLTIEVTNVWANRLIGDEQEPPDMEWVPGQYFYFSGQYLKEFPDWFLHNTPRPSKGRYCFTTWNYFDKNSPLISSGLMGPVKILAGGL